MKTRDYDDFLSILLEELTPKHEPRQVVQLARWLVKKAKWHERMQCVRCNRYVSEVEEEREERVESLVTDKLKPFNITPIFGGDPRGATIKLKLPSGRYNDWGGTGICVPV